MTKSGRNCHRKIVWLHVELQMWKVEKIKDIREHLHMETNEFNPYRKRLIKKGILSGETRGYVYFTLPLFEEYIMEND